MASFQLKRITTAVFSPESSSSVLKLEFLHGWVSWVIAQKRRANTTVFKLHLHQAVRWLSMASNTLQRLSPDVKIEILIMTRMVTDESLTVATASSCCCLFERFAGYTNFRRSTHRGRHIMLRRVQQIQCLLVIFVEIFNVIVNKVTTLRFQLTHTVC